MYIAAQKEKGVIFPVLLVVALLVVAGVIVWFIRKPAVLTKVMTTNVKERVQTATPTATVESTAVATPSTAGHPQLQSKPPIPRLKSIAQ